MVRTFKLNDGKTIPAMGWGNGTGAAGDDKKVAEDCGAIALSAGILHIDTAQGYETEPEVPKAIAKAGLKRSDVWVTTKYSFDANTPQEIKDGVKESLEKLGFIPDAFLIHSPYKPAKGKMGEFWQTLEELVNDGTLKGCSLGVSNFRPQDFADLMPHCTIKPALHQIEYHPYLLAHLEPVLKIHKENDIVCQAYGSLSPMLRHKTGGPLKPILTKIAKKLTEESGIDVDENGVLLLWTMNTGACAITTSAKEANIKKMASVEKVRDLNAEEIEEITTVGKKIHFRAYREHMENDFPLPNLPEDL